VRALCGSRHSVGRRRGGRRWYLRGAARTDSRARVIGTASEKSFEYLRGLGAEPVKYGEGLGERVRALASSGVTAATDLFGTEAANLALELGVPAARVSMIAGQLPGVTTVAGFQAVAGTLEHVAALIAEGKLKLPIAATYPIEKIRDAVTVATSKARSSSRSDEGRKGRMVTLDRSSRYSTAARDLRTACGSTKWFPASHIGSVCSVPRRRCSTPAEAGNRCSVRSAGHWVGLTRRRTPERGE
jgi:hypothetical protein